MKDVIYPAVLYKDKETGWFTIAIHELGIVTEGDSVEKAFMSAKEYLEVLFECSIKFDCELERANKFSDVYSDNPNNIVILVDAQLE